MGRIERFRKGDRAEYLAQVFLSSIAFSNPIYRQEDYGIDFACSLIEKDEEMLHATHSFNIQVKSSTKEKYIEFNHRTPKELFWLFNIQDPYFLGFINTEEKSLSFFSIAQIFTSQILKLKSFNKIRLHYITEQGFSTNWYEHTLKNKKLEYRIGKPFLKITFDDLMSEAVLEERKRILRRVIEVEKENLLYKNLKLPLIRWLHEYTTNNLPITFGWAHYCGTKSKKFNNPDTILYNIGQLLISLAKSYELYGDTEMYNLTKKLVLKLPMDNNYESYLKNLGFIDNKNNPI